MKIKKYIADTEHEAIEKAKQELGANVLILEKGKAKYNAWWDIFKKRKYEITAAYDDNADKIKTTGTDNVPNPTPARENTIILTQHEKIKTLEEQLNNSEELINKMALHLKVVKPHQPDKKYSSHELQVFYNELIRQGVTGDIAEDILSDATDVENGDESDISLIVKIVYNNIIKTLGNPDISYVGKNISGNPSVMVFIGPTGVGKTTTIAKISSDFILNQNMRLGLITADTYRIAAVNQLKTYADILGIDIGVVYGNEDLLQRLNEMKAINDVILIDTAGRSHKNTENINELAELLQLIPDSEKYLVLSLTTKYEDLLKIVQTYSSISNFKIIFTKADETDCYGSILNICYMTGKKVSYLTNGQNVPDDIEVIRPDKIAKALLGLGGGTN